MREELLVLRMLLCNVVPNSAPTSDELNQVWGPSIGIFFESSLAFNTNPGLRTTGLKWALVSELDSNPGSTEEINPFSVLSSVKWG